MVFPHCFYLFLKFTHHSMKLTFLFIDYFYLFCLSLQTIGIQKSHLLSFTNLSALINLFTPKSVSPLLTSLTCYITPSLVSLHDFRIFRLDCPISNLNSKYLRVNLSLFFPKPAVLSLCPMCAYHLS